MGCGTESFGRRSWKIELNETLNGVFHQLTASMEEKDGAFIVPPQVMRRFGPGLRDLGTGAVGNTNEGNAAVLVPVLTSGCGSNQLLRILYTEIWGVTQRYLLIERIR